MDIDIVQSIPIQVLPMSAVEHYGEPSVPAPQIVIEMPPLRALRSIVDRLKALHRSITLEASRRGTLVLRIDTLPLTLQTLFAHLRFRDDLVDEEEEEDRSDEEMKSSRGDDDSERKKSNRHDTSSVTVDAKVLGKAILMDNSSADNVLCCKCFELLSVRVQEYGTEPELLLAVLGITENRALVLHTILVDGFGSITCYLPVLTPDD